jgi:hypothetical protein
LQDYDLLLSVEKQDILTFLQVCSKVFVIVYFKGSCVSKIEVHSICSQVCVLLIRRYRNRNIKSMNFDNPVYRKTTTAEQDEDKVYVESSSKYWR